MDTHLDRVDRSLEELTKKFKNIRQKLPKS